MLDLVYNRIDRLSGASIRLKSQDVGTSTRLEVEGVQWCRHCGMICVECRNKKIVEWKLRLDLELIGM